MILLTERFVLTAATFRDLVSGKRRGPGATLLRAVLRAAETPYTMAMRRRNRRYDTGRATIERVEKPVISVGNLTLGGTGKTPMVEYIARWLWERNLRPAIVSRGYKASAGRPNDEALELAARLPGVPHIQGADRVWAAREAIARHGADVIVADDGFQHRRLGRDLDIVLLDATCPFGFGHVFPRGLLREPAAGLARAGVVVLSRADLVAGNEREAIRREAARLAPRATWVEAAHAPLFLINAAGERKELDLLHGKRVAAFCGIGNPAAFEETLRRGGCDVVALREFPDHHAYSRALAAKSGSDETQLAGWARDAGAEMVVTTHKDLVKLPADEIGGRTLWAVVIGLRVLSGERRLDDALAAAIAASSSA